MNHRSILLKSFFDTVRVGMLLGCLLATAATAATASAQSDPRQTASYAGVWQRTEGGGTTVMREPTFEALEERRSLLALSGLRLVDVETFVDRGERVFLGAFRAQGGEQTLDLFTSAAELRRAVEQASARGLELADVEVWGQGVELSYMALWNHGHERRYVDIAESWSQFVDRWRSLYPSHLRLIDVEIYEFAGAPRVLGVWASGSDEQHLLTAVPWQAFHENFHHLQERGARLVDIEISRGKTELLFTGIWRAGSSTEKLAIDHRKRIFDRFHGELTDAGFGLIDFEGIEGIFAVQPLRSHSLGGGSGGTNEVEPVHDPGSSGPDDPP